MGEFEMTLEDVRTSIERKEKGGRGIVSEQMTGGGKSGRIGKRTSHVTKNMVKSIKSPALKRRLLRHVKPMEDY